MSANPIDKAVSAFEDHFKASSEDPSMEGDLKLWLVAWNAALAAASQPETRGVVDDTVQYADAHAQVSGVQAGEAVIGVVWDDGPQNSNPGAVLVKRGTEDAYIAKWGGQRLFLASALAQQPEPKPGARGVVDEAMVERGLNAQPFAESRNSAARAWQLFLDERDARDIVRAIVTAALTEAPNV